MYFAARPPGEPLVEMFRQSFAQALSQAFAALGDRLGGGSGALTAARSQAPRPE